MSTIAGSYLFLARDFTDHDSSIIDRLLGLLCDEVRDTRKGRHWEAYLHKQEVGLTIHVYRTDQYLYDCEDELLELELLPDDAPECITIITNRGTENDLKICELLTRRLSEELECLTLGARLCS